ncbi:MAG: hypothetical protein ACP5MD_17060, partial [Verrucomicrobiia bacterium]
MRIHAVEFLRWIERYRAPIGNGKAVPKTARVPLQTQRGSAMAATPVELQPYLCGRNTVVSSVVEPC